MSNTLLVRDAEQDRILQRTRYYASGLPTPDSWGQSTQSYKYNGKELIDAHGLDEYDFGLRHYYAATARFTTPDPMTEMAYHISPYSYAANNSINNIDFRGLMPLKDGMDFLGERHYTEIANNGIVVEHIDNDDNRVMLVNESGEKRQIGTELAGEDYSVGRRPFFRDEFGRIRAYYDYLNNHGYTPDIMETDQRIREWLLAHNMDNLEYTFLYYLGPILQGVVLLYPTIEAVNNYYTFVLHKNIYDTSAKPIDYALPFLSEAIDNLPKSRAQRLTSLMLDFYTILSTAFVELNKKENPNEQKEQ